MRTYVSVTTVRDGNAEIVPNSLLYNGRRYFIKSVLRQYFDRGVTVFQIQIGKNNTYIYRDEYTRQWYVLEKNHRRAA